MTTTTQPSSDPKTTPSAPAGAETSESLLGWLFGLIFNDIKTKLTALVFAILVWVYINNEITTDITLVIPLRVEVSAPSIMITDVEPRELKLVLAGPKEKISQLQAKLLTRSVRIQADELPGHETARSLELSPHGFFKLPSGIKLRKPPKRVKVTIMRSVTKSLKVVPSYKGAVAAGFEIKRIVIDPTDVRLRGSVNVMRALLYIKTKTIDISGRDTSISLNIDVQDKVENEPVFYLEDRKVRVTIEIAKKTEPSTVTLKRVIQVMLPADFPYIVEKVEKPDISLVVTGPRSLTEEEKQLLLVHANLLQFGLTRLAQSDFYKGAKFNVIVNGLPPGFSARVLRGKEPVEKVYIKLARKN